MSCLLLSLKAGLVFVCLFVFVPEILGPLLGGVPGYSQDAEQANIAINHSNEKIWTKTYSSESYQGFNFFHLSLYHTGPALSYWAFNFLESPYMCLSGLVKILKSI